MSSTSCNKTSSRGIAKTRTPFKVLQLLSCPDKSADMSATKKFGQTTARTTTTSRQFLQTRSSRLADVGKGSSLHKQNGVSGTSGKQSPPPNNCDKTLPSSTSRSSPASTRKSFLEKTSVTKVSKDPVSSEASSARVHSLMASPKWAKIKDKFESCDTNSTETDKLRPLSEPTSIMASNRSIAASKTTGPYLTNLSCNGKTLTNGISRSSSNVDCKTKPSNGAVSLLRDSAKTSQESRDSAQSGTGAAKSNLNSPKSGSKNIPLSARSAASSLLASSGRLNSSSRRHVNSEKSNSSSTTAKCNGNSQPISSLPSSKSDSKSCSSIKKCPVVKVCGDQEINYQTSSLRSSSKDSESTFKTTKSASTCISKSSMRLDLKSDHMNIQSSDQERKVPPSNKSESQSIQVLPSGKSEGKNLWVKDKSGNWVKNPEPPSNNNGGQCKGSAPRNKLNSVSSNARNHNDSAQVSVPSSSSSPNNETCTLPKTSHKDVISNFNSSVKPGSGLSSSQLPEKVSNSEVRLKQGEIDRKLLNISRRSMSSSSSSNESTEKNCSSIDEDDSPDKVRKLSLVQRAVLSYEENLSLLSPETQRKLKLLGEKVRAQAENDKLFVSTSTSKSADLNVNVLQKQKGKTFTELENKKTSNELGEKVPPVRSFLSKYNVENFRKGRYNCKGEAAAATPPKDAASKSWNHAGTSIHSKDLTTSETSSCISENSEMTSSDSTLTDSVSSISVKALTQRFGSQLSQDSSDSNPRKSSNTRTNNIPKNSGKSLKPNQSFLWRNMRNETSKDECENRKKEDGDYHKYYVLESYYSPCDNSNQMADENPRSFEPANAAVKLAGGEARYQNLSSSDSSTPGKPDADDDGWTDLTEEEDTMSKSTSSKSSTLRKKKASKKHSHHRGQMQRSWSQSFREIAKADLKNNDNQLCNNKDKNANNENYNESNAPDYEHFYEPVYESLNNYMVPNDDNEAHSISPDDGPEKDTNSSYTSLESLHSEKVESNQDLTDKNLQKSPENTKKGGGKMRKLRRNWSWTKSDIKLELSSKFNKIKIKKNSPHSTEIGLKMQDNNSASTSPKKNTFIKCILKQKSASEIPVKKSLSPKKESAHFYVHLSMSSGKQRPFSDSCVQNPSISGLKSSENCVQESRKSSDSTHGRYPTGRLRKGFSGQNIQRPTSPPPLPPTQASTVKKVVDCELKENVSSLHKIVSRNNSLTSESKPFIHPSSTSSSHYSESVVSDKGDDNLPTYSDIDYKSCGSIYATIDSLSRTKRNSVGSSGSFESYALADESGSSGASTSTTYSSGFTLHIESDFAPFQDRRASSRQSNLSLPLVKEYKSELLKSPFEEEPLYQFYHKNAQERATMWYMTSGSESEFEDMLEVKSLADLDDIYKPRTLQSQTSAMDLIHKEGGQRTLWCEVPEVRESKILDTISAQDRKIQEAMFEVITSEASYLKSLNFLLEHFVQCPEFCGDEANKHILDKRERHILFSDVPPVRDVSASLLSDLEKRWLENIVISDVCDIVYNHASKYFSVYVKYCSNQIYQDRTLKQLKETRPQFVEVLKRLESSPVCQGLDMHSFLMLPMQRITRLPLLIDAVFHRLPSDSPIYESCKMALGLLNKLVAECNEGARKMERMEEMLLISHQIDFKDCKGLGLLSASRWLVKKGELVQLVSDAGTKRAFGRNARWCKIRLFLFLFTDMLVITKKKSDESYCVVDYCPRNMVQVMLVDENTPLTLPPRLPSNCKNIFQLIMLSNKEGKTVEMLLACVLESDRTRWMDAVTPPQSQNPDEKIYEEWDCPQVQCTHAYTAQQPDELTIEESDVVNVFRKMADGWYEGERIRDGLRGWFPSSHTVEIASSHVRARNLRQRYRLLMLSQTYLEEQQKAMASLAKK